MIIGSDISRYKKSLLSRDPETRTQAPVEELEPQALLIAILCWSALQLERSVLLYVVLYVT
jgi:hypothetical protein